MEKNRFYEIVTSAWYPSNERDWANRLAKPSEDESTLFQRRTDNAEKQTIKILVNIRNLNLVIVIWIAI